MTRKQKVSVNQTDQGGQPFRFEVFIEEGAEKTRHQVTMDQPTWEKIADGRIAPLQCIDACIRFLLDREPKEAILSRFDVTVIPRYFPGFFREIGAYLEA